MENLYVDDYLGGADEVETAKTRVAETNILFSEAQLNMRSYATNSEELRQHLEEKGLENQAVGLLFPSLDNQQKVLGIRWDTGSDTFQFDPSTIVQAAEEIGEKITKRKILSISARIFDPLGFLAPTVLLLKIIYQRLWEKDVDWDGVAPEEIQESWRAVMKGVINFNQLKIPRWVGFGKDVVTAELHVFGDASEAAYGAVAYVRLQRANEKPFTTFLVSKTKVAPLPKRKVTLPRLELLSSLLAVRLGEAVRKALHIEKWRVTYWSDSLVTLGWIRGDANRWKPFVRNQVETIQSVSEKSWWKHCKGVQNTADLASRGVPAQALVNSQLWWHGPEWLIEEEDDWPDSTQEKQDPSIQETIDAESRGAVVNITAAVAMPTEPIDWDLDVVSTWNRFLRSRTWMLRFSNRSRKRLRDPGAGLTEAIKVKDKVIRVGRFASEELDEAELTIYRQLQKEKYPKAYETLQLGLPIHQKENFASLNSVWDERDKLIRISGRVILALRDKNIEPPILLPANHKIVSFIIADKHESLHHAGVKTTLSNSRKDFGSSEDVSRQRNSCSSASNAKSCHRHHSTS
jgi:hypothetical protein